MLTKKTIDEAERYLKQCDPVMKGLIRRHGPCPLGDGGYRPFHTLVVSIINQQLSAKVSDVIQRKLAQTVARPFFQPQCILSCSSEDLRATGLSATKVRCIQELAARVSDGRLLFSNFEGKDDQTAMESLLELPGIGSWTAEMFMIFGLKRPDVLPLGDGGLQKVAMLLYGKCDDGLELLKRISEAWRPYRSVASWYLWRYLDVLAAEEKLREPCDMKQYATDAKLMC